MVMSVVHVHLYWGRLVKGILLDKMVPVCNDAMKAIFLFVLHNIVVIFIP